MDKKIKNEKRVYSVRCGKNIYMIAVSVREKVPVRASETHITPVKYPPRKAGKIV